jgi:hypothetical protein
MQPIVGETQQEIKMRYFSTATCQDIEIDPAAAELPAVLDAYNSLFEMSDSGGAYPGSKAWTKAKVYSDKLAALVAARPDIEAYRTKIAADKRDARLAGKDIMGM